MSTKRRKPHKLTKEGRKAISDAQKRRWRLFRAAKKAKTAKRKRA